MAATTTNRPLTQDISDTVSGLFYREVSDWMPKLKRVDVPLSKTIGVGPAPSKPHLKLEWGWGSPVPNYDTLAAAVSDTTTTTITVTNPSMWAVSDMLRIDSENLLVTAVNTGAGTLTVAARGTYGTAATHSNGVGITRMAAATRENQNTPLSPITQGELDYNYFQQIERSIQISHRADVTPTWEKLLPSGSRAQAEMKKKMEWEVPTDLEQTLLFGTRTLGDTGTPSTMGGILTTPSYITYRNTSLSGPLTERILLDQLQTVYQQVGQDAISKKMMAHPFVCQIIASFYNGARRLTSNENKVSLAITEIDTGWFGTIQLVANYWMQKSNSSGGMTPLDQLFTYDPADLKRVPYSSDSQWAISGLPEEGWFKRLALRGDWTLVAQNPDARMLLGGFSVSSGDYPGMS